MWSLMQTGSPAAADREHVCSCRFSVCRRRCRIVIPRLHRWADNRVLLTNTAAFISAEPPHSPCLNTFWTEFCMKIFFVHIQIYVVNICKMEDGTSDIIIKNKCTLPSKCLWPVRLKQLLFSKDALNDGLSKHIQFFEIILIKSNKNVSNVNNKSKNYLK